jgi:uncharacterized membrane protein YoaK (UPF0700 family)
MNSTVMQVWKTIVPPPGDKHGPLRPMLIGLTVVSGIVDAFSFLLLGRIFVANVTGDVLFVAFGLAGAHGFSVAAALITLGVFFLGAFLGGRLFAHFGVHRGHLLTVSCLIEAVLFGTATVIASTIHGSPTSGVKYGLIVLLGLAMGLQNALAFKLAIPGMTTSVVTQAITGISAESPIAGGSGSNMGARVSSTLALFLGALVGALLVLKVDTWSELLLGTLILTGVGLVSASLSRSNPTWAHPA